MVTLISLYVPFLLLKRFAPKNNIIQIQELLDDFPQKFSDSNQYWFQHGRAFPNAGSLLLARVIAVTFCVTLAASMAARLGPTPMAAFQTCLQVWMTSSLLADGLAVAGQVVKQNPIVIFDKVN